MNYKNILYYSLAAALVFLAIGGGVGLAKLGRAISQDCSNQCAYDQGDQGCLDWSHWGAIVMQLYLVPIGVLALGVALVEFGQRVSPWALNHCHKLEV
jgi:hypothetical protein